MPPDNRPPRQQVLALRLRAFEPKKTGVGTADTGKVAGGKPATGRLCQAGQRKIRRVSGASPDKPTPYRGKSSRSEGSLLPASRCYLRRLGRGPGARSQEARGLRRD